jgi:hypothetical protein
MSFSPLCIYSSTHLFILGRRDFAHHQDWAGRVAHDPFGHTAQHDMAEARPAV